eukprot:g45896.t1
MIKDVPLPHGISYMIPFSDHNLITIDFKLPNSYFQSAKQAVGPQLKFEWKRKVDISPVAHSFPVVPAYLMNAPVDDILTFFYDTYCPIIDTLAKKSTRKTTMKHPGFIHDYEIKQLKIKKNKLLRNLQNTATLQDRQTIKDKLKVINKTIQKRVKYAKNERQKKDLLQVNDDMKRNPKKAWYIVKRIPAVTFPPMSSRFFKPGCHVECFFNKESRKKTINEVSSVSGVDRQVDKFHMGQTGDSFDFKTDCRMCGIALTEENKEVGYGLNSVVCKTCAEKFQLGTHCPRYRAQYGDPQ